MKKVLVSQKIIDQGMDILKGKAEVIVAPDTTEETLINLCGDIDAIVLRTTSKITPQVIAAAPKLKIISRTGAGVDNIDIQAATERGILISHLVGVNSLSVAEHAISMILTLAKQLPYFDRSVREGNWNARNSKAPVEVEGQILGIVALGNIGSIVARKCCEGLGMRILAYDPYAKEQFKDSEYEFVDTLEPLFKRADFITLHCPNRPETQGMINRNLLESMKSTAFLINTSRGSVIDESALVELLRDHRIAGAALDVFSKEPPDKDHPLLNMNNVILSPHAAALTKQATIRMAVDACQAVIDFFDGKLPKYIFNRDGLDLEKALSMSPIQ